MTNASARSSGLVWRVFMYYPVLNTNPISLYIRVASAAFPCGDKNNYFTIFDTMLINQVCPGDFVLPVDERNAAKRMKRMVKFTKITRYLC